MNIASISENLYYKVESAILKESLGYATALSGNDFVLNKQHQVPQPVSLTLFHIIVLLVTGNQSKHI